MNNLDNLLTDKYLVQIQDTLTAKARKVLLYLYQPLIGSQAVCLYQFLQTEGELVGQQFSKQFSMKRILNFWQNDLQTLRHSLQLLIKHGLIKILCQDNLSLFEVVNPLSVEKFLSHHFFGEAIKKKLSSNEINEIYSTLRKINFTQHFAANSLFVQNKNSKNSLRKENKLIEFSEISFFADFPNWVLTERDKEMIIYLQNDYQISTKVWQCLIHYILKKNAGRLARNHLFTIILDLHAKDILYDEHKVKEHFHKIKFGFNKKGLSVQKKQISRTTKNIVNWRKNLPFLF